LLPIWHTASIVSVAFSQTFPLVSACRFEKEKEMSIKQVVSWGIVVIGATLLSMPARAADKSDIAARAATWEKEYNAGNLAAIVALYADDGCRMPPNQETVHGKDAILAQLKAGKDNGAANVKIAVTSSESNGDLGYGTGTYVLTGADGSHVDHGKWMLVEKKVGGTWKTECDIFNSDMPMPGAAMK
jgi:ketosteroid isomerase-like protein